MVSPNQHSRQGGEVRTDLTAIALGQSRLIIAMPHKKKRADDRTIRSALAKKRKNNMALKIEHIDNTSVRGTLDGALDFNISQEGGRLTARIANWTRAVAVRSVETASEMRQITYETIARYREDSRGQAA
jgi:hypothetical protein